MRFAVESVQPALTEDGQLDGYGDGPRRTDSFIIGGRWLESLEAFHIREGEFTYVKGGFKKPPKKGDVENFEIKTKRDDPTKAVNFKYGFWVSDVNGQPVKSVDENGEWEKAWCKVVGRIQAQGSGPAPQSAPARPASAPQGHTSAPPAHRPIPTMSQAVAVLRECVSAVEGWGSDAHATTLFLGRLRGDIVRDPSPAELAAAQAAREAAAQGELERAEREAEAARERARAAAVMQAPVATAAGYEPAPDADGKYVDIPF